MSAEQQLEQQIKDNLRNLALTNFDEFMQVVGIDMDTLKICHQRRKGKSLQQIANMMQMPKATIQYKCKVCK